MTTNDIDAIEACIKNGAYHEMDLRALCAEVRELRALIKAHNERVAAACKWRQENGHCDYAKRGDLCPDCPQEWEIGND